MHARLSSVVLAVSLALPAVAAAQAPWSEPRRAAGWVFTPTLAFGAGWDDNVALRGNGSERPSDAVGLVHPRGEIEFNGRRTQFSAGYSGSWSQYRELSELDQYLQRGRITSSYRATPHVTLRGRSTATFAPSTDLLEIDDVPFSRVGSQLFDVTGGVAVQPTRRTTVGGSYMFQRVHFNRDEVIRPNLLRGGYANAALADVTYKAGPRLGLSVRYDVRLVTIEEDVPDQFTIQNARSVVDYELGRTSKVSGGAGISSLHVRSTRETLIGPSLSGSFSQRIERVVLGVHYDRAFVPAFGFGGTSRSQTLGVTALVPLFSGRLTWSTSAVGRHAEPVRSLTPENVTLRSYWVQTNLGYAVARWLRVEGYFSGSYQNTLRPGGRVERNRVGLQFVTTKPMRIQ